MRCTLPSYRRAQGTDKKETGNEEGWHRSGEAEQKNLGTEANDRLMEARKAREKHRSAKAQADLTLIRAQAGLLQVS